MVGREREWEGRGTIRLEGEEWVRMVSPEHDGNGICDGFWRQKWCLAWYQLPGANSGNYHILGDGGNLDSGQTVA